MGLLDIFSKEKREERARAGNIQRAINKYSQSGDRYKAMEALASEGSDEALYGLMRRFGMMYDKSIEDEQEKEWVFDTLVSKGERPCPRSNATWPRPIRCRGLCACCRRSHPDKDAEWTPLPRCWRATSPATSATPPRRSNSSATSA
jgi:hypothetical protein